MAPSDTLLVGSRPSAAGALPQEPHLKAARTRTLPRPGDGVLPACCLFRVTCMIDNMIDVDQSSRLQAATRRVP